MKIGFISDIHSNIYGLREVVRELNRSQVKKIFCAGDVMGYYPFPNEVCEYMRQLKIPCVKGNLDAIVSGQLPVSKQKRTDYVVDFTREKLLDTHKEWLKNLPKRITCDISGKQLLIVHGSPWDELNEYVYPDYDNFERFSLLDYNIVVMGHTHYPFVRQEGDVLLINAGSCGQPRDYIPLASAAIYDTQTLSAKILRVEYNIDAVASAAQKLDFPEKVVRILYRRRKPNAAR